MKDYMDTENQNTELVEEIREENIQQLIEKYNVESRYRRLGGLEGKIVSAWLVAMSLFHLYIGDSSGRSRMAPSSCSCHLFSLWCHRAGVRFAGMDVPKPRPRRTRCIHSRGFCSILA